MGICQSCIYCFGTRFGLAIGIKYFGTGQYRRSVSGLPLIYIYINLLIYMFIDQNLYNLLGIFNIINQ